MLTNRQIVPTDNWVKASYKYIHSYASATMDIKYVIWYQTWLAMSPALCLATYIMIDL